MARPSKYSEKVVSDICARLAEGEPMAQICRDEGMPAYRTVKDWADEDSPRGKAVSAAIARAREEGFDALAAECLEIADDGSRDYTQTTDGRIVPDHDHIQRSKLRIETRLKLLAKWDPKRYGEAVTLKGDKDNPVEIHSPRQLSDADLLAIAAGGLRGAE